MAVTTYGSNAYGAATYGSGKPSWPIVKHEINTTADPNDPAAVNTWVDVTDRVISFDTNRGRADELSDVQTGVTNWTLINKDGRFDAANSASDLYPYLLPNRQARTTVTWAGVTYPVFFGYEEKGWPLSYQQNGRYGLCTPSFVDAIGPLGIIGLTDVLSSEMLADAPVALYAFGEPAGTPGVASSSGVKQPIAPLVRTGGGVESLPGVPAPPVTGNTGTQVLGAPLPVPAVPSGATGLGFTLQNYGDVTGTEQVALNGMTGLTGLTVEGWFTLNQTTLGLFNLQPASGYTGSGIRIGVTAFRPYVKVGTGSGYTAQGPAVGNIADDLPHHLLVTHDGTNVTVYVDGVAGTPVASALPSSALPYFTASPSAGYGSLGPASTVTGAMAYVGVYRAALSPARILAHYQAGALAGLGDTVGQRVTRVLNYIAWLTGLRSIDLTSSGEKDALLQAALDLAGSSALSALQQAVDSANGLLDVDATGKIRYRSRDYKSLQTSPVVTFGEFQASGEVPYLGDIAIGVDPTKLYSIVQVEQANGVTIGRSDAAAVRRLFGTTLTRQVILSDVGLVADMADMLLRLYKAGQQRVTKLTVDPGSNPAIWPQVLALDYGSRVRVKRRQAGAPTKTLDCYIESMSHTVTPDSWQMSFLMSPVPLMQPWILGDPTYGVLGTSTFLTA